MTRRLWPLLRLLGGAGVLAALVAHAGTGVIVDGLRSLAPGPVLAALGLGLLTTVLSAGRWCLVARGLGLPLSLPRAVADCYRAVFLNSVLPAGVLGDLHRAVSHGHQAGNVGRGVRAVVLERVAGQVVLVVLCVGLLLAEPTLLSAAVGGLMPSRGVTVWALAALPAVIALAAWAVRRTRAARLRNVLRTGLADARAGLLSRGTWPWVVLLSVAALAGYLALFVVAARAAGSHAALGELLPLLMLGLLVMGLPLNIAGWGPREAVTTIGFGSAGFGATQGLTAAVVYGLLSLIACLPGLGVLLLQRPGRHVVRRPRPAIVGSDGADLQENGWHASRSGGTIRGALGRGVAPCALAVALCPRGRPVPSWSPWALVVARREALKGTHDDARSPHGGRGAAWQA